MRIHHLSRISVCIRFLSKQLCAQHVFALKMWAFMPNRERVSALITHRIKEDSLRTFLFAFASATTAKVQAFGALSLPRLARYRKYTRKHACPVRVLVFCPCTSIDVCFVSFYLWIVHAHCIVSTSIVSRFLPDSTPICTLQTH